MASITEHKNSIIILGAGLAGCIASHALKPYNPIVLDRRSSPALGDHKAVMRMRDLNVALLLGLPAQKVSVRKAVWTDGELKLHATIKDNNSYSIKTSGFVGDKSILNTQQADRYLMPLEKVFSAFPVKIAEITRITSNRELILRDQEIIKYDFCISTIPMPAICKMTHINIEKETFKYSKIIILHYNVEIPAENVYQTIYYPDLNTPLYRASLQNGIIIAEIIDNNFYEEDITSLLHKSFGIPLSVPRAKFVQENGKMHQIDDRIRKKIIYTLTEQFNIFSLGRYAIWKPIRSDHLIRDLAFINELMSSKDNYDLTKWATENES